MSIILPPNGNGTQLQTHLPTVGALTTAPTLNAGEVQHVALVGAGIPTYSAGYVNLSAGTGATFAVAMITGSATKTIKVLQVVVQMTTATAGVAYDLQLVKCSSLPTGGTGATAATIAPWDSGFGAASAVTKFFTTATTADGTVVGFVYSTKLFSFITPATTVLPPPDRMIWTPPIGGSPVVLHGAAQCLTIDINGVTPANATSWDVSWVWTEE